MSPAQTVHKTASAFIHVKNEASGCDRRSQHVDVVLQSVSVCVHFACLHRFLFLFGLFVSLTSEQNVCLDPKCRLNTSNTPVMVSGKPQQEEPEDLNHQSEVMSIKRKVQFWWFYDSDTLFVYSCFIMFGYYLAPDLILVYKKRKTHLVFYW